MNARQRKTAAEIKRLLDGTQSYGRLDERKAAERFGIKSAARAVAQVESDVYPRFDQREFLTVAGLDPDNE